MLNFSSRYCSISSFGAEVSWAAKKVVLPKVDITSASFLSAVRIEYDNIIDNFYSSVTCFNKGLTQLFLFIGNKFNSFNDLCFGVVTCVFNNKYLIRIKSKNF